MDSFYEIWIDSFGKIIIILLEIVLTQQIRRWIYIIKDNLLQLYSLTYELIKNIQ